MAVDAWAAGSSVVGLPSVIGWKRLTVCPPWVAAAYGELGNVG